MIYFKVKESILRVGPRKGQKAYSAVPKAPNKFTAAWLVDRIVRETSLSEGDVRNVLITLRRRWSRWVVRSIWVISSHSALSLTRRWRQTRRMSVLNR